MKFRAYLTTCSAAGNIHYIIFGTRNNVLDKVLWWPYLPYMILKWTVDGVLQFSSERNFFTSVSCAERPTQTRKKSVVVLIECLVFGSLFSWCKGRWSRLRPKLAFSSIATEEVCRPDTNPKIGSDRMETRVQVKLASDATSFKFWKDYPEARVSSGLYSSRNDSSTGFSVCHSESLDFPFHRNFFVWVVVPTGVTLEGKLYRCCDHKCQVKAKFE